MVNVYPPTIRLQEKGLHERLLKVRLISLCKLNPLKETPVLVVSKWNNMGLCHHLHLTAFSRVPLVVTQSMWIPFISKAYLGKKRD